MQRGYDEIIATYDKETMEEIAGHGCASGVCFKHIYYGDTIAFYDKYEDEILDYFTDNSRRLSVPITLASTKGFASSMELST